MSKKSGIKNRIARDHLVEMFGKWWQVNDIDVLQDMIDEIVSIPAKTKIEKVIVRGMFFRIYTRR